MRSTKCNGEKLIGDCIYIQRKWRSDGCGLCWNYCLRFKDGFVSRSEVVPELEQEVGGREKEA